MAVTISNYGSLFTNVLYEQILLNEGSEFHEVYFFIYLLLIFDILMQAVSILLINNDLAYLVTSVIRNIFYHTLECR